MAINSIIWPYLTKKVQKKYIMNITQLCLWMCDVLPSDGDFRVLVQAAFSLFNLPLADIIDSDLQKYKRRYLGHC